jgi:hypothetical protein
MKMKKNVYKIRIPGDLGTAEEICDQAITEAHERAWLFIPASWEAQIIEGTVGESYEVVVKVTRWHN